MTATMNNSTNPTSAAANRPAQGVSPFHDALVQAHSAKSAADRTGSEKAGSEKKVVDKKTDSVATKAAGAGKSDATPVETKGVETQSGPWTLNQPVGQPTNEAQDEPAASGTETKSAAQGTGLTASADASVEGKGLAVAMSMAGLATNGIAAGADGQAVDGVGAAIGAGGIDGVDTVDGADTQSAAVLDAGVSATSDEVLADAPAAAQLAAMLGIVPVSAPVPSAVAAGFSAESAAGLEGLAGLSGGLKANGAANGAANVKGAAPSSESAGVAKSKVPGVEVASVVASDMKPAEIAPVDAGSHRGQGATSDGGFQQMVQAVSAGAGAGSSTGSGSGSEASSGSASSDALSQATPTGVGAGWDGALQPAMSSAQLIQTIQGSEMRMGLNSDEFGNLSITTSISRKVLSAQIATEHSGLGRELALQMPAFQEQLGKAYGLQARVEVRNDSAGTQSSTDGASSGNGAGGQQSGNAGVAALARGGRMQFGPVKMEAVNVAALAPGSFNSGSARLDVRV